MYKYDAALSFAGEDRKLAASLSRSLIKRGFSVFYDADREAHLWGKTSKEFERIYGPQSRYVIPIVSRHYVAKPWTLFEFETALQEQEKRSREFILPIRLDDSRLLGLPHHVIRQDARKKTVQEIAELFAAKCRRLQSRRSVPPQIKGARKIALNLLQKDARHALCLIATAAIPLLPAHFKQFFPKYDWRKLIATFRHAGFLDDDTGFLRLTAETLNAVRGDLEQGKWGNEEWINRLSKLEVHIDVAPLLAVHYVVARRLEDAARVVVNICQYTNLGWWNDIYLAIVRTLAQRPHFAKLSPKRQIELLNSLGTCLCQAGEYGESMKRFDEMRRLSKRYKNAWGVGQSFINAGVSAHRSGNDMLAEQLYRKATKHGKETGDRILRGRALNNLAQLCLHEDADRAEHLLEESLKLKAAANDFSGLLSGLATRGNLAAARGDFPLAIQCYSQTARTAKQLGLRYEQALSTYNQGRALQDAGLRRSAVRFYIKARALGTPDDYTDILILCLNALGASAFVTADYKQAHRYGLDLLMVAQRAKNQEYELGALHMIAMSSLARSDLRAYKREIRVTIDTARSRNAAEWVVRALVDSTRSMGNHGLSEPDLTLLQRIAKREAGHRRFGIAAEIWRRIASINGNNGSQETSHAAFIAAQRCLSNCDDSTLKRLQVYRDWFGWAWRGRRYNEAVLTLKKMEHLARRTNHQVDAIAAMDQQGICLQEMGNHEAAERLHRAATAAAKRQKFDLQVERSLNNLGEALRKLGRHKEAVGAQKEAEEIARRAGRHESALSTAHNRALSLQLLNRFDEAVEILRNCRDDAGRRGLWHEYVRAWEALANLHWGMGKQAAALRLYARAQNESQKRQIGELAPRIALNFARLLRTQGKKELAVRTLEPFRTVFDRFVDAYEYYGTLAGLYECTGHLREAASTWSLAKARAEEVGNQEYASYCAAQEADSLAKLGRTKLSKDAVLRALRTEHDPRRRANLLIQSLRLRLTYRYSRSSDQAIFDEVLRLCTDYHLPKQKVELYLLVGDHDLSRTYDRKLNAFKAYAMAMMSSIEAELSGFAEVIWHIVLKIALPNSPIRSTEFPRLLDELTKHLAANSSNANKATKFVLWPFEWAAQLFPFRKQPHRLLEAVYKLVDQKNIMTRFEEIYGDGPTPRSGPHVLRNQISSR